MIKPRIPGQPSPVPKFEPPAVPTRTVTAQPLVGTPPTGPDMTGPLRARLVIISEFLEPLLKERDRLTAAIKALTE